jgi:hypothetical protein
MDNQESSIGKLHKLIIEARKEKEIGKYWESEGDLND